MREPPSKSLRLSKNQKHKLGQLVKDVYLIAKSKGQLSLLSNNFNFKPNLIGKLFSIGVDPKKVAQMRAKYDLLKGKYKKLRIHDCYKTKQLHDLQFSDKFKGTLHIIHKYPVSRFQFRDILLSDRLTPLSHLNTYRKEKSVTPPQFGTINIALNKHHMNSLNVTDPHKSLDGPQL